MDPKTAEAFLAHKHQPLQEGDAKPRLGSPGECGCDTVCSGAVRGGRRGYEGALTRRTKDPDTNDPYTPPMYSYYQ